MASKLEVEGGSIVLRDEEDNSSYNRELEEEVCMIKKGPWTSSEDAILVDYVEKNGEGNWNRVHVDSGLARCGKSCRLRWTNHLRPNLKKGALTSQEQRLIVQLHQSLGNRWAKIAQYLPGRTDNEIKNFWNTRKKRRMRAGLPLYPLELSTHLMPHPFLTTTNEANLLLTNPLHGHGYGYGYGFGYSHGHGCGYHVMDNMGMVEPSSDYCHPSDTTTASVENNVNNNNNSVFSLENAAENSHSEVDRHYLMECYPMAEEEEGTWAIPSICDSSCAVAEEKMMMKMMTMMMMTTGMSNSQSEVDLCCSFGPGGGNFNVEMARNCQHGNIGHGHSHNPNNNAPFYTSRIQL